MSRTMHHDRRTRELLSELLRALPDLSDERLDRVRRIALQIGKHGYLMGLAESAEKCTSKYVFESKSVE